MISEVGRIAHPQVKLFYTMYLSQRNILHDFYKRLPEDQFDYRLIDIPERRADSPGESLVHLLEYRLLILNALKIGRLVFGSIGIERYQHMTKEELLAVWSQIEQDLFDYLNTDDFEGDVQVTMPWGGEMSRIETLYLIRDHDILHVGWNLALMDVLKMERFPSLMDYWG